MKRKSRVYLFSRVGGDIPAQGKRSDIKKMKDAVLNDPKVKVSDLIEDFGHAGTMLRVIDVLRSEASTPRDRVNEHKGTHTHTHTSRI